jgi:hypothetical protein
METWTVINPDGKEYRGDKLVRLCLDAQREHIGGEEWLKRLKKGLEDELEVDMDLHANGTVKGHWIQLDTDG